MSIYEVCQKKKKGLIYRVFILSIKHKILGINFGQVGAGSTVTFLPSANKKWIQQPIVYSTFHEYAELTVCGDSLIGDGINNGDVLIARTTFEQSELKNGRLVLILLPTQEPTVKHIYFDCCNDKIILKASNPNFDDLIYDATDVRILGLISEHKRTVW